MFSVDLSVSDTGTELERLVAKAIGSNPVAAAAYALKTVAFLDAAKKGALRITAARLRKSLLEAYDKNPFNWPKHGEYSRWLGIGQSVTVAWLTRANRPIKTTTKSGKARKAGYSQRAIKPPVAYPLGGRLPKATRYKLDQNGFVVGILNDASQNQKNKMERFQDGRTQVIEESSRRYLAALGIFIRRGAVLKSPLRKVYDPVTAQSKPDEMFERAFIDILTDKLQVRE